MHDWTNVNDWCCKRYVLNQTLLKWTIIFEACISLYFRIAIWMIIQVWITWFFKRYGSDWLHLKWMIFFYFHVSHSPTGVWCRQCYTIPLFWIGYMSYCTRTNSNAFQNSEPFIKLYQNLADAFFKYGDSNL